MQLYLSQIRTDGGTQPRAEIDWFLVQEYADAMADGDKFPDVDVFFDGTDYWLAEGFHRYHATEKQETNFIGATIHQGTREDAVWFSCAANAKHGKRRSNADKRRAMETALRNKNAVGKSNRQIAQHCGVDEKSVRLMRTEMEAGAEIPHLDRRTGSDGKSYPANIGKHASPPEPAPEPEPFAQTTIDDFLPPPATEPTVEELKARLEQAERLLVKAEDTLDSFARTDGIDEDPRYREVSHEIDNFFSGESEPDEDDDEPDEDDSDEYEDDDETPPASVTPLHPSVTAHANAALFQALDYATDMMATADTTATRCLPFTSYLTALDRYRTIDTAMLELWIDTHSAGDFDMVDTIFSGVTEMIEEFRQIKAQRTQRPLRVVGNR